MGGGSWKSISASEPDTSLEYPGNLEWFKLNNAWVTGAQLYYNQYFNYINKEFEELFETQLRKVIRREEYDSDGKYEKEYLRIKRETRIDRVGNEFWSCDAFGRCSGFVAGINQNVGTNTSTIRMNIPDKELITINYSAKSLAFIMKNTSNPYAESNINIVSHISNGVRVYIGGAMIPRVCDATGPSSYERWSSVEYRLDHNWGAKAFHILGVRDSKQVLIRVFGNAGDPVILRFAQLKSGAHVSHFTLNDIQTIGYYKFTVNSSRSIDIGSMATDGVKRFYVIIACKASEWNSKHRNGSRTFGTLMGASSPDNITYTKIF